MGVCVGDFVRADIVRKLTVEQIKAFGLAVHHSKLPIDEGERGLAVLVSPLRRFNRRNPSACEVSFHCKSEPHVESASVPVALEAESPDTIFIADNDADKGWEFRLASRCDWRGWSRLRPESGVSFPSVKPIDCSAPTVAVVVTIYNRPSRFVPCINSIIEQTKYPVESLRLVLVDDGSDEFSQAKIKELAATAKAKGVETLVIRHPNIGYLISANRGVYRGFEMGCDLVCLVNSDVLVTCGWLSALVRCHLRTGAGLVNPLSNQQAAISVPLAGEKSWGFPRLPGRVGYIKAAELCSIIPPKYPDAVTSVGQCLMIDKATWSEHGPFDHEIYGSGYGEECELWARLVSSGGVAKVADDAYVYHESHGTHQDASSREEAGAKLFISRWRDFYNHQAPKIRSWPDQYRKLRSIAFTASAYKPPVRFIAYNLGPYGGVHCILRLVDGLNERGFDASVEYALEQKHHFKMRTGPSKHADATSLRRLSMDAQTKGGIIVATHWFTGEIMRAMASREDGFVPLAFWQDREDLFVEPDGSYSVKPAWVKAYTAIENRIVNARWVGESAQKDLGIDGFVHIPVGVDCNQFYPKRRLDGGPVSILAMYRPSTPRRGAKRIKSIFSGLRKKFGRDVVLQTFGEETTIGDFNFGALSQDEVSDKMREADIVIEPSDFQGFGLPGLEAMASGAVLVSTDNKGIHEYGVHNENALICQTDEQMVDGISELIADKSLRKRLADSGRDSALRFDWELLFDRWADHLNDLLSR